MYQKTSDLPEHWNVRSLSYGLVIHERVPDGQTIEHFNPSHRQNNTQWDDLNDLIDALLFQKRFTVAVAQSLRAQARSMELEECFASNPSKLLRTLLRSFWAYAQWKM